MNFLKKILEKAKKACLNKPFNLKKTAKEISVHDYGSGALSEEQLDAVSDIVMSLLPEQRSAFERGEITIQLPDALSSAPIASSQQVEPSQPISQAPQKVPVEIAKDDVLRAKLLQTKNYSIIDPARAEQSKEEAVEYLQSQRNIPKSTAEQFINTLLQMTEGLTEEPAATKSSPAGEESTVPPLLDPSDPDFLIRKLMQDNSELYLLMQKKIEEEERAKGSRGSDPSAVMDWVLDRNLKAPTKNLRYKGESGVLNKDYRAVYFFENPGDFPIESFQDPTYDQNKVNKLRELLSKYGFNPTADWREEILPYFERLSRSGKQKASDFSNELMAIVGEDLISKIGEEIENDPEKVARFAVKGRGGYSDSIKEFSGMTGEEGEDLIGIQTRSPILAPEDILDIRDEALQRGEDPEEALARATEQAMRGQTPEEKKDELQTEEQVNQTKYQPLIQMFTKNYLQEVMKETQNLGQDIVNSLLEEANKQGKTEKKIELGDIADRLLVYINTAVKQIDKLFNSDKNMGENFNLKFNTSGDKVYSYQHPTDPNFKIDIPKDALTALEERLKQITGKEFYEHVINGEPTPEAAKLVEEIAKTSALEWQPNWSNWVRPHELNKKLNELGETKMNIKSINDALSRGGQTDIDTSIIYEKLSDIDKAKLTDVMPYQYIPGFIERTKKQEIERQEAGADRSIYSNWLYAGQPGVPDNLYGDQRREFIMNKINDPTLSPKEREKWTHIGNARKVPKQQFETNIVSMIPVMEQLSGEGKYSSPAFKAFFNIVPPHKRYMSGAESEKSKETGKSALGKKDWFSRIHDLIGTVEGMDPLTALRLRGSDRNKQKELKEIEKDTTLQGPVAKADRVAEKEAEFESIGKAVELMDKYSRVIGEYNTLKSRIDKEKKEIQDAENNAIRQIKKDILSKTGLQRIKPDDPRWEMYQSEWLDEQGNVIVKDKKNKKRIEDALKRIEKWQEKLSEREQDPKLNAAARRALLNEIEQFKKTNKYYKTNKNMQDAMNVIANSNKARIIYAMYIQDKRKINQLFTLAKAYDSMKLASNYNDVESMIDVVINKYKNILGL